MHIEIIEALYFFYMLNLNIKLMEKLHLLNIPYVLENYLYHLCLYIRLNEHKN